VADKLEEKYARVINGGREERRVADSISL